MTGNGDLGARFGTAGGTLRGIALAAAAVLIGGTPVAVASPGAGNGAGEGAFSVTATMPDELVVGEETALRLTVEQPGEIMTEFWWVRTRVEGEIRRPMLLVEHHDKVELSGAPPEEMVTPDDFQVTYLRMPYGRRILAKETEVAFTLTAEPGPDDVLALNVITYLEGDAPRDARFVRRRVELPLRAGATAAGAPSDVSRWGEGETLSIGDVAPDFELPDLVGRKKSLSSLLDDRRVLILAYRRAT